MSRLTTLTKVVGRALGLRLRNSALLASAVACCLSPANAHAQISLPASGDVSTIAGRGSSGEGDGGKATSAELDYPWGVAIDASGNVYVADSKDNRIRAIYASGTLLNVS